MSSNLYGVSSLHRMVRYDARTEIMNTVGDLSGVDLIGSTVLVAPYVHSGILWNPNLGFPNDERLSLENLYELYESKKGLQAQNLAKEGIYQGKVLLLLKTSRKAQDDRNIVGSWIFTLQENTTMLSFSGPGGKKSRVLDFVGANYPIGWPCKIMDAQYIMGHLSDPDMVV
jgi:hypothetical protein